jgi:hypothetical protein
MTRKQIVVAGSIVIVVSLVTAIIAYRAGRTQTTTEARSAAATAPCVDFHDAGSHTGQTGCISGQVLKVFASGSGNTFLDFCADYRKCPFTSVVFSSDRRKFGDLSALAGKRVEVRGPITTYNGRAEIIIRQPQQIRERDD